MYVPSGLRGATTLMFSRLPPVDHMRSTTPCASIHASANRPSLAAMPTVHRDGSRVSVAGPDQSPSETFQANWIPLSSESNHATTMVPPDVATTGKPA